MKSSFLNVCRASAVVAAIPFLSGCLGGGPNTSEAARGYPSAASGTISQTTATAQAATLQSAVIPTNLSGNSIYTGLNISFPTPPAFVATIYDDCTTATPATRVDADGDGIKAVMNLSINCTGIRSSGYTYNWVGTNNMRDTDDTNSYGGFAQDFNWIFSHRSDDGTNSENYAHQGSFAYTLSTSVHSYVGLYNYTGTNTYNGTNTNYTGGANFNFTWTDTGTFPSNGTASLQGFYKFNVTENSVVSTYIVRISSTDLTYNSGCSQFYNTGSVTFTDASNNAIKYTYGCTTVTKTYNGTAI